MSDEKIEGTGSLISGAIEVGEQQEKWEEVIYGNGISLHLAKDPESPHFKALCQLFNKDPEEISEDLETTVFWTSACACPG